MLESLRVTLKDENELIREGRVYVTDTVDLMGFLLGVAFLRTESRQLFSIIS